jgi:hypothetical protein
MVVIMRWRRHRTDRPPPPPRPVRVAIALHEPEAQLLIGLLEDAGIPAMQRRSQFDNPNMMAGGAREILVPARCELEARALLDPRPDDEQAA